MLTRPIFQDHYHGQRVRGLLHEGQLHVAHEDICRAIGIRNPAHAVTRLDPEDRRIVRPLDYRPQGGGSRQWIITLKGVRRLLATSVKDVAAFRRWFENDYAPRLRDEFYGASAPQPEVATPDDLLDRLGLSIGLGDGLDDDPFDVSAPEPSEPVSQERWMALRDHRLALMECRRLYEAVTRSLPSMTEAERRRLARRLVNPLFGEELIAAV